MISSEFHNDFFKIKNLVFDVCGLKLSDFAQHTESLEYGACSYILHGKIIQHRVSKITPTKAGQFVTLWHRNKDGFTQPFKISDKIDFVIIVSRSNNNLGLFIFPKNILADKGIISVRDKDGKRGTRVYPPWSVAISKQAKQTQSWQLHYFLTIHTEHPTDLSLIKNLFAIK